MGRLTLNILLSFAQFEREVIGERIRDKFASRKRGLWMGGYPPCGAAARLLAPVDLWLGRQTTIGSAFIAMSATKPVE
jgi:DNA invertase Pin-like site-specific DNA recombinase